MKTVLNSLFFLISILSYAQTTLSGTVFDKKKRPLIGANIYIEGSYDGSTTDSKGCFSFTTNLVGKQVLTTTALSFENLAQTIDILENKKIQIELRESVNALDAVVISAGTFEAGDKSRVSVLKPLDIVTTAGAAGDIVAALQTLPGTQTVGESGRLFVRGGEADETQTFVDGLRVAQPYGASTQNLPSRGRFSPFLFSGISFSTGGYSAEYGEALSSVLLLNTINEPDQDKTDISLMTVGLGIGNTQKWNKSALTVNATYINLAPYQALVPQNVQWNKPFQSLAGETVYRYKFNAGRLKIYTAFDASQFDINQQSVNKPPKTRVDLNNNNFYLNSSYKGYFGTKWQLTTGLSYGYNRNNITIDTDSIKNKEQATHLKLKVEKSFSDRIKWAVGGDYFLTQFEENYNSFFKTQYTSHIAAAYTEMDVFFSKYFVTKAGIRVSNNSYLNQNTISPRLSLAYKTSKNGQFSLGYGTFEQAPKADYLKYSNQFTTEKAAHYILNYQFIKNNRTLRLETYYKDYNDLVKYNTAVAQFDSKFSNNGNGYATGLDVFWRDGSSIKNLEYWLSYSYIDSKRDYQNFSNKATPSFIAKNNWSLVTKYFVNDWKSQLGFSYSINSGRPYNNPNETVFMNGKTKEYSNLSFNWAYLLSTQKILYFSVSNVLGTQNVYGYQYANNPDSKGVYNRMEITPTADRFFFLGFFWTISTDKNENQLKNL